MGQWVDVSGRLLDNEILLTTGLTLLSDENRIQMDGTITAMMTDSIVLDNGLIVDTSQAILNDFGENGLAIGQRVEVVGLLASDSDTSDRDIVAQFITLETSDSQFGLVNTNLSQTLTLEGEILNYVNNSDFIISGVQVDASNAVVEPSFIELTSGLAVEATGRNANGVLSAEHIYLLSLREEGTVTNVDLINDTLSLQLNAYNTTIVIDVTSNTAFYDKRDSLMSVSLDDIAVGDLLNVSMSYGSDNSYTALDVTRLNAFTGANSSDPAGILPSLNVTSDYSTSSQVVMQHFFQSESAQLELILESDIDFGRITALDTATLNGDLLVTNQGLSLEIGDQFDIFDGQITGEFSSIILPDLDQGLIWDTSELYTTGVIRVRLFESMQIEVHSGFGQTVSFRFFGTLRSPVQIDWGDGEGVTNVSSVGTYSHTYSSNDTYLVNITGEATGFGWEDNTPVESTILPIVRVVRWGDSVFESLHGAFRDHRNLTSLPTDLPSTVQNLRCFICGSTMTINDSNISAWDVSNVTQMNQLFEGDQSFHQDLSGWKVSNVTNMNAMFKNSSYNQPIGNWDVKNVTDMGSMFFGATQFNQPLNWDVSNVIQMSTMFFQASAFNQLLGQWNVSSVLSMNSMFRDAVGFDQDISAWELTSVTDMAGFLSKSSTDTSVGLSTAHYDALLRTWPYRGLNSGVTFDAGDSVHSLDEDVVNGKNRLETELLWTVSDGRD